MLPAISIVRLRNMRTISGKRVTGILIILLCGCLIWNVRRTVLVLRRVDADCFNPRLPPDVKSVFKVLGPQKSREHMAELALQHEHLYYGSGERFCHVHPDFFSHSYPDPNTPSSDGVGLMLLDRDVYPHGNIIPAYWYGPPGLKIKDVTFTPQHIRIMIYGRIQPERGSTQEYMIPEEAPLPIEILWLPGRRPKAGILNEAVSRALRAK